MDNTLKILNKMPQDLKEALVRVGGCWKIDDERKKFIILCQRWDKPLTNDEETRIIQYLKKSKLHKYKVQFIR